MHKKIVRSILFVYITLALSFFSTAACAMEFIAKCKKLAYDVPKLWIYSHLNNFLQSDFQFSEFSKATFAVATPHYSNIPLQRQIKISLSLSLYVKTLSLSLSLFSLCVKTYLFANTSEIITWNFIH